MYHSGIVFQKHVVEIFWNEGGQAGPRQGLVVEVQEEEGSSEAVEALPVDEAGVVGHPGLQHSLELPVAFRRGQELIVLVTTRDVHFYLSVNRTHGLLVYCIIQLKY